MLRSMGKDGRRYALPMSEVDLPSIQAQCKALASPKHMPRFLVKVVKLTRNGRKRFKVVE